MPFGVIIMCCMGGCGLMPLSGMVDVSSFLVNTDWKYWPSRGCSAPINPSLMEGRSSPDSLTLPHGHSASRCLKDRAIIISPTSKHMSHPATSFWHSQQIL